MESPQPQLRRGSYDPRRSGKAEGIITATPKGDEAEDIIAATPNGGATRGIAPARRRRFPSLRLRVSSLFGGGVPFLTPTSFLPLRLRRYAYAFFLRLFPSHGSYAFFLSLFPSALSYASFLRLFLVPTRRGTFLPYAYAFRQRRSLPYANAFK